MYSLDAVYDLELLQALGNRAFNRYKVSFLIVEPAAPLCPCSCLCPFSPQCGGMRVCILCVRRCCVPVPGSRLHARCKPCGHAR